MRRLEKILRDINSLKRRLGKEISYVDSYKVKTIGKKMIHKEKTWKE
jgi:hypothetical protein